MHERLTDPDLLLGQMEPIHAAASSVVLASLLPAIQVAWADGTIQERERALILKLADESGLAADAEAMARITGWLATPPTDQEMRLALDELRALDPSHEQGGRVLEWAQAVARADGGILGFGAISKDERAVLGELEAALGPRAPASEDRSSAARHLGALEVMRDLLAERLAADTQHVELVPKGVTSMWPQPSPWDPDRMPPTVLGVPEDEYRDFMTKIIGRYVASVQSGWWSAVRLAVDAPGVAPMDDRELARLIYETPFSRFLVPSLDPVDERRFAGTLAGPRPPGVLYKVDLSHLASWRPLPGLFVAGTVGLFALEGSTLTPLAIAVGEHVARPGDGESWARARYFLVSGCSVTVVIGIHPFLHFPMDSVIGVSREVFDEAHPIGRLIEAHAYLHLPLDYGVRWNARSVAHNHQQEIYTPFPVRREDVFRGVGDCYAGIAGNSGFPGFRYPMSAPSFPGEYCRFLAAYYDVVLRFTRRLVAMQPGGDASVTRWASVLAETMPGFPSADDAMRDPEILARALAGYVHAVSIWHSAEHHAYAAEPVTLVPQRLRVPPPTGKDARIPPTDWLRGSDIARQEMARRMFYEAHTVRSILEVDYGFTDPEHERAAREFQSELRACDASLPRRYIELARIACSLQF
jgi:tellurite resistance protein